MSVCALVGGDAFEIDIFRIAIDAPSGSVAALKNACGCRSFVPTFFHVLIFSNEKIPFLRGIAFNCRLKTVVAHIRAALTR